MEHAHLKPPQDRALNKTSQHEQLKCGSRPDRGRNELGKSRGKEAQALAESYPTYPAGQEYGPVRHGLSFLQLPAPANTPLVSLPW